MKALNVFLKTPEFNVVIFSLLLNLAWEFWQVPFYRGIAGQPHWLGIKMCTQATFGDVGIALTAFWVTALFARTRGWLVHLKRPDMVVFMGTGLVATIVFEALTVGVLDRWAYTDAMPRLPILGTGLLPLLQWIAVPLLVVWFARRQMDAPDRGIDD